MQINLESLFPVEEKTEEFHITYDRPTFDDYRVVKAEPLVLTVTHHKDKMFTVSGDGKVVVSIPCDRCLKPVETEVEYSVFRDFDMEKGTDEDNEPFWFITEAGIDCDVLIDEEIRMNIPMKVLCKDDCKGICHRCGADLNLGECNCDKNEPRSAMAEALMKAFADAGKEK